MPEITLSDISLSFGPRTIFNSINFSISDGHKIALTGANGSGKTTLMKLLCKLTKADSGSVSIVKNTKVSYLPQSGIIYKGTTLFEEVEKAFKEIKEIIGKMEEIEEKLAEKPKDNKELLNIYNELQQTVINSDYYIRDKQIEKILTGLGFMKEDFYKLCSEFSSGWQMRIALAKVLLEDSDIILLDEPTNYLDIEAREWLEIFLNDFKGGMLIVSHDKYFLDTTVNSIAEIYNGKINIYKGNYSKYEKQRSVEIKGIIEKYKKQQEEIERIESFIRRFRSKATKASLVQSRIKYLEKMERIEIPEGLKKIHFKFPDPPHCGKLAFRVDNLSKSYNENTVFKNLALELSYGERLALAGPNGAGKSTLMRILAGIEKPDSGSIKYGSDVSTGYFSQETIENFSNGSTIIKELESVTPIEIYPQLRNILGSFLFIGDDIYKSLSVLSGGEKSRIALLKILLHPMNLLFLDEPTNHLDMESKNVLLDSLNNFKGTLVFVSHDHYFIDTLATKILELNNKECRLYYGDYSYYLWKKEQEKSENPENSKETEQPEKLQKGKQIRTKSKELKSRIKKLKNREEAILLQLDEIDEEKDTINKSMSLEEVYTDGEKIRKLKEKLSDLENKQKDLSDEWEKVEEELNELKEYNRNDS